MKKVKKSMIQEVIENAPVMVEAVTVEETKQLGRPINPESNRQKRIAELEQKRINGELKRGRPVVAGSKRQQVLEARAAKLSEGYEPRRGRPVNAESKRQQVLMARATKVNEGGELRKGRPVNPESKRQQELMAKAAKVK